ncbi:phosphotriesterase-related protein [Salicibibacter halophilus]|uniref:Phosphotriesterase-related protein n=1 Tax=Salicibibacter halophilus TaxID=2502791 RepID=A0A514LF82_9BACI|nr:phosphotriesterase-related protein [Salicibibacter halophilus]QDI90512.1 phosphotriesterase-related protein [Salicibibacter halophilus]
MSQKVNTVLGPVLADELGKTLMHEHFFFGYPGFYGNSLYYPNNREEILRAAMEFAEIVQAHGVKTVVDATPNDTGRDPELLKEIAERTGLNIICSTGYYYEGEGAPAYFKFKQALGTAEDEIYELFMGEITEGIGKTGIKPGVIKLGSGKDAITDYEEVFFKVAAKVQKETGISIITHTQEGTMGPEQAELLVSEGADPKRILIGHMDGNTDINYHLRTLENGVFVGFDRFGIQGFVGAPMDNERVGTLLGLIGSGYTDQLMMSHDKVNFWLGKPPAWPDELKKLTENWHPGHIFQNIIPALKEGSVTEEQINTILVKNPNRIFGGREAVRNLKGNRDAATVGDEVK